MVDLRDPEDLLTLLRRAKGSFGIVGEPAKGKLCIRITEEDRARIEQALGWTCKAQPTAAVPSDCNHPFCGCDPHAERIIRALVECGWGPDK